jgi:chromosome segregation protein
MRLERIEINGFKSFSDRSELAFDKGVTAIVGPNGCGKSNVADAITWVMGEQSAKSLRGDRMEDVIFNGSDARKPTASAEVRLRFSGVVKTLTGPALSDGAGNGNGVHGNGGHGNRTDANGAQPAGDGAHASADNGHHGNGHQPDPAVNGRGHISRAEAEELIQSVAREVEVTRRLYRSGESEYRIDGEVCRLRDIHDLLMDTGLGAKAYAIIEQGKIGLILSSRPTDRRQLIEEAAGVTKYKARRRAAELKLEAARQNLTRIDDVVFEVEKQRNTLRRQAAKARRYRRLRDELRRWEKVLFTRKHRQLSEAIDSIRGRLAEVRAQEGGAAAAVAALETDAGRLRLELVEAETRATETRQVAHDRELTITRRHQQIAFDREQVQALDNRARTVSAELDALEARREPTEHALSERRRAALEAEAERDRAAARLVAESEAYETAHRGFEGLEGDVEAARSEVFSAINAATALRHSLEHAASARDRVLETLSKLQVESDEARMERERTAESQNAAADGLRQFRSALEAGRVVRAARESELASANIEHDWRARAVRSREQEVAGLEARLASLEELDAARAAYGDAVRTVLAHADGQIGPLGAVADYLEVDAGYERAVEACLGDLLQHVIVARPEQALAGLQMLREQSAGRCGFLIASTTFSAERPAPSPAPTVPDGLTALSSVVHINGPHAQAIGRVLGAAWIAAAYDRGREVSSTTTVPVATLEGDVFRGADLVAGGGPPGARGILQTKREIRDLRARLDAERSALAELVAETGALEATIGRVSAAIAAHNAEQHRQEKDIVALEAQLQRATDEAARVTLKSEQLGRERRQAEEEREALGRRQEEALLSIERLEQEQRLADDRLTVAQRRLFEARENAQDLSRRVAEAGVAHAALVERAGSLAADVKRLEEASAELVQRAAVLSSELAATTTRATELRSAIVACESELDAAIHALEDDRARVLAADESVAGLRTKAETVETDIKGARGTLDRLRKAAAEFDVSRATKESELALLTASFVDTMQTSIDDVFAEVAELERAGGLVPDARVICAEEADEASDDAAGSGAGDAAGVADAGVDRAADADQTRVDARSASLMDQHTLSAEEAIAHLRAKIDRLGPVNMMAIDQFDELESRHAFLVTQRQDLIDSVAQTTQVIKRIDETTRERFLEAFVAINQNFQTVFGTLFGGGRAGLTLLDEADPLESGIEIVAQPPGKRLQSVQLLSGGEKALTAISLMFALFKYKPSPFCLLDEIDAPLDDANIGRFVEMLRSMQQHTQFILITHNRKTMEIADRLYGVTMEEPGVSKLISVQLN